MFTKAASKLRLGNGLHKETDVGPVVNLSQMEKVLNYIDIGKKEGARLLVGGRAYREGTCGRGHFIEPTIFSRVEPGMRIAREGDLRACSSRPEGKGSARRHNHRERYKVRTRLCRLHPGCEQFGRGGTGTGRRHCVYKRFYHWCRDPAALWRDKEERHRPQGGRRERGRPGHVHQVEGHLP